MKKWKVKRVDIFGDNATVTILDTKTFYEREVVYKKTGWMYNEFKQLEEFWNPKDRDDVKYLPGYLLKDIVTEITEMSEAIRFHKQADEKAAANKSKLDHDIQRIVTAVKASGADPMDVIDAINKLSGDSRIWLVWYHDGKRSDVAYSMGKTKVEAAENFNIKNAETSRKIEEIQLVTYCSRCGDHTKDLKVFNRRALCDKCIKKEASDLVAYPELFGIGAP